jgi:hypothetical protein
MFQALTCRNIVYLLSMEWTLSRNKCSHDESYMLQAIIVIVKAQNAFKNPEAGKTLNNVHCVNY